MRWDAEMWTQVGQPLNYQHTLFCIKCITNKNYKNDCLQKKLFQKQPPEMFHKKRCYEKMSQKSQKNTSVGVSILKFKTIRNASEFRSVTLLKEDPSLGAFVWIYYNYSRGKVFFVYQNFISQLNPVIFFKNFLRKIWLFCSKSTIETSRKYVKSVQS